MSDPYGNDRFSALRGPSGYGGAKDRFTGGATQAKTKVLDGFSRVVDAIEGQIHRAPADIQPTARKGVAFARERPLATMAGLAVAALFLTRGSRRR